MNLGQEIDLNLIWGRSELAKNLEIGSGGNPQPGYIHTDLYVDGNTRRLVDIVCDARSLPFPDGDFDNILMFGVFEHFSYSEAQEVLLEVSRVLKTGGTFRFDVPDFDWFIKAYLSGGIDPNTSRQLDGVRDEMWIMKGIFGSQNGPGQYHKWGWNQTRMNAFLSKPNWGFSSFKMVGRKWRDPEANHLIYDCVK